MKIAFYAPLKSPNDVTPSGDREIARNLMTALRLAEHDVELASELRTFEAAGDPDEQRARKIEANSESERLLTSYASGKTVTPEAWVTYHVYHKAPDWIGPVVTKALGIPYIIVEASISPSQDNGKWASGHRAACNAVANADVVIGLNPRDAECVEPFMAKDATYTHLPPFLATNAFESAAQFAVTHRQTFASRHDVDANAVWLLSVGMMRRGDKYKSYGQLARALAQMVDVPWHLFCVGDGPEQANVHELFSKLSGRVTWIGRRTTDEMPSIYAACDVFAWPAVNEALGMVFLEAGASGVPTVAGYTDGVASIVQHGETGLVAPANDPVAFAKHLKSIVVNPTLRQTLGRAATAHVKTFHGLASAAQTLDDCLKAANRSDTP